MNLDIDPVLWRSLVAVADSGGFTRAARQLNRTQSAVSMQIRRLEDAIGLTLFKRGGSAVLLTRDGEGMLAYARRILALQDEALSTIAGAGIAGGDVAGRRVAGLVRLGTMDDYATTFLPPLLARFQSEHPQVDIEVHTGLTATMHERVGRDLDLLLGMQPAGTGPVGGGRGTVLRTEQPVWAVGKGSEAHHADPLPLALYPQGCLFRAWAFRALDAAGRRWRLAYMSPSLGAVAAAAEAGLAVGVFKAGTLPGSLRRLDARHGLPSLPLAEIALYRPAGRLTPAVAKLGDFLEAGLRKRR